MAELSRSIDLVTVFSSKIGDKISDLELHRVHLERTGDGVDVPLFYVVLNVGSGDTHFPQPRMTRSVQEPLVT